MVINSSSNSRFETAYDSYQMKKQHVCISLRRTSDSFGYSGASACVAMDMSAMGCNEVCCMVADSIACMLG